MSNTVAGGVNNIFGSISAWMLVQFRPCSFLWAIILYSAASLTNTAWRFNSFYCLFSRKKTSDWQKFRNGMLHFWSKLWNADNFRLSYSKYLFWFSFNTSLASWQQKYRTTNKREKIVLVPGTSATTIEIDRLGCYKWAVVNLCHNSVYLRGAAF